LKVKQYCDPVKIALVRKDFLPKGGGGERYSVDLARALRDSGHEVHVFAHRYEPLKGLSFHSVAVPLKPFGLQSMVFARNARLALSRNEFDIVNGLSQIYPQDVYRVGDGIHKHWLDVHPGSTFTRLYNTISPRHRLILNIERKIFTPGNYKRVVAISNLCKQHAITYYNVPSNLIDVIYCGVNFDIFNSSVRNEGELLRKNLGIDRKAIVVLFVGMNFARKGLASLLRAVSQLRDKEKYRVLIVGKGNIARYIKLARELGLDGIAMFCGFQDRMPSFYGCADVFVLPSYYEPLGNACLEAMACGLPVIATRETGASELVSHGRSGFVMDKAENTLALATWLEVLQDPEVRRSMGSMAQEQVAFLTVERNAKETVRTYEKTLEDMN
jgi:UDP-glucose:(heptosyl)LPS alpha-1,3-glucosyltransferase